MWSPGLYSQEAADANGFPTCVGSQCWISRIEILPNHSEMRFFQLRRNSTAELAGWNQLQVYRLAQGVSELDGGCQRIVLPDKFGIEERALWGFSACRTDLKTKGCRSAVNSPYSFHSLCARSSNAYDAGLN